MNAQAAAVPAGPGRATWIKVMVSIPVVLQHAVELAEQRIGETVWERQARGLDEIGYAIVRKDDDAQQDPPVAGDLDPVAVATQAIELADQCMRPLAGGLYGHLAEAAVRALGDAGLLIERGPR